MKEVVLISGLSLVADVEEEGEYFVLKNAKVVLPGPSEMALAPITKISEPPQTIKVRKDMVLSVTDLPPEILLRLIKVIRETPEGGRTHGGPLH